MPVILALRKLWQEDAIGEATLGYIGRSCLKTNKKAERD